MIFFPPLKYPKSIFVADTLEWRQWERILFVNLGKFFFFFFEAWSESHSEVLQLIVEFCLIKCA